MPSDLIIRWARQADILLAADSGGDVLLDNGLMPAIVVGDMDSTASLGRLRKLAADRALDLILNPSQSSTDCDKLLDEAFRSGYEEITLAGVEGDQLDHVLAVLHSAARSPLRVRIALRTGVGWVLSSSDEVEIATKPGRRVSVLPLTNTEGVSLRGVEWPLEQTPLNPLGATSISNVATGEIVSARVEEGSVFLFVEHPPEEMPFW